MKITLPMRILLVGALTVSAALLSPNQATALPVGANKQLSGEQAATELCQRLLNGSVNVDGAGIPEQSLTSVVNACANLGSGAIELQSANTCGSGCCNETCGSDNRCFYDCMHEVSACIIKDCEGKPHLDPAKV